MEEKFKVNELTRDNIEEMAIEKFKAIKLQDDLFIIPGNVASTEILDQAYIKKDIFNEVIIGRINSLDIEDGDTITINCEAELADNKKVMEVINLRNEKTIEFDYLSSLCHEEREVLVNTIASIVNDKKIIVSYYLPFDFSSIKDLVINELI